MDEEAEVAAVDSLSRVRPTRVVSGLAGVAAVAAAPRWAKGEEEVAAVRKPVRAAQADEAEQVPEPEELEPASEELEPAPEELLGRPELAERAPKGKPR